MKRLAFLALSLLLFSFAMPPASVDAQTCSCPWQVMQGGNTASDCATAHSMMQTNLRSFAYFACGNRPLCTSVYTPLSCGPSSTTPGWVDAEGLLNYKCC